MLVVAIENMPNRSKPRRQAMSGERPNKQDVHADCLETIRKLTEQRDELLKSTERLLTVIGHHLPSLEEMAKIDDIRRAMAKAHGEVSRHQSGRMVEIPLEKFYRFDRSIHAGAYAIKVDSEAGYGFFEDDQQGDEHGGSMWFAASPEGQLTLTSFDGIGTLPPAVVDGLERLGIVVANRFK